MLIFLLLLNLIFLNFYFFTIDSDENFLTKIRLSFIKSILIFSLLIALSTEFLSYFNGINSYNIAFYWGISLLCLVVLVLRKKQGPNFENIKIRLL